MYIYLTSGIGFGKTLLSSFDSALFNAGISNYNLITLSSIIPPDTIIKQQKFNTPYTDYGHRLYVVMSENRSRESGRFIGSALGWCQEKDGRGVFVEHRFTEDSEEAVRSLLEEEVRRSLSDLCRQRGFTFTTKKMKIKMSVSKVSDTPTCTLVAAVYKSEPWFISKPSTPIR